MLSVLIIGCGNIAGGFDRGRDPAEYPFTHAGAYRKHGGFQLAACVEPDAEKRDAFMRDWDVPLGFASVTAALSIGLVCDVVSVCSPTVCHAVIGVRPPPHTIEPQTIDPQTIPVGAVKDNAP